MTHYYDILGLPRRKDEEAVRPAIPGNIDLNDRPVVVNNDGSVSTVRSVGINADGEEQDRRYGGKPDRQIIGLPAAIQPSPVTEYDRYVASMSQPRESAPVDPDRMTPGIRALYDEAAARQDESMLARGLKHGLASAGETMLGTLPRVGGQVLGIPALKSAGEKAEEYFGEMAKQWEPPERISGSILDDPGLLKNGSWWAYNVADMIPSMATAMAGAFTGGATTGAVLSRFALSPAVIRRAALLGASIAGGAVGGSMEGAQTYKEVLERTGDENAAAIAGTVMSLASAGLNALSFGKMLSPGAYTALKAFVTKGEVAGLKQAAKHMGLSGLTEATTEYLEEPAEAAIKQAAIPGATREEFWNQLKEGLNVAPPSLVMGLLGGMAGGKVAHSVEGRVREGEVRPPAPLADASTTGKAVADEGKPPLLGVPAPVAEAAPVVPETPGVAVTEPGVQPVPTGVPMGFPEPTPALPETGLEAARAPVSLGIPAALPPDVATAQTIEAAPVQEPQEIHRPPVPLGTPTGEVIEPSRGMEPLGVPPFRGPSLETLIRRPLPMPEEETEGARQRGEAEKRGVPEKEREEVIPKRPAEQAQKPPEAAIPGQAELPASAENSEKTEEKRTKKPDQLETDIARFFDEAFDYISDKTKEPKEKLNKEFGLYRKYHDAVGWIQEAVNPASQGWLSQGDKAAIRQLYDDIVHKKHFVVNEEEVRKSTEEHLAKIMAQAAPSSSDTKQPWEMSRKAFYESQSDDYGYNLKIPPAPEQPAPWRVNVANIHNIQDTHAWHLANAISLGKDVRPEIVEPYAKVGAEWAKSYLGVKFPKRYPEYVVEVEGEVPTPKTSQTTPLPNRTKLIRELKYEYGLSLKEATDFVHDLESGTFTPEEFREKMEELKVRNAKPVKSIQKADKVLEEKARGIVHIPGMSERERIATEEEQARLLEEIRLSGAHDQIDAIRKIGVDPASVRADYGSEGVGKMNKVLPTLVRKGGMPLDVLAADHGFESADDLYDFVVNRYRPKKQAKEEQRVLRGSAKRRENFLRTDKATGSLKAVLDGYLPKDAVESVESPKRETGAHQDLKAIGKELGFEVRFFESKHPLFEAINGLVGLDGTIYINTRSKYPILSVLGHEISHVLKTNHPDLYAEYEDALRQEATDYRVFEESLLDAYKEAGINPPSADQVFEEFGANFGGQQFMDAAFWRKVREKNPSLIERILSVVRKFIARVRASSGTMFHADAYLKDVERVRDALVKVMTEARELEKGRILGVPFSVTRERFRLTFKEREEIRKYLEGLKPQEIRALKDKKPAQYRAILKSIVRKLFPRGADIQFRREGKVMDYEHFLTDQTRQDYIHTLPSTLRREDIKLEFKNGDIDKELFIKKYFDPEIQKDIWDVVVLHNNEIRTKIAGKEPRGRRYVEGLMERNGVRASVPSTPEGDKESASTLGRSTISNIAKKRDESKAGMVLKEKLQGLSKTGAPRKEGLAGASPSGAESNILDEVFPVNAEERIDEEITENRKAHELLSREPVKIRLGELEGLSGKELRDKAEGIYRGLSTATNKIDGKMVKFVQRGFREMKHHSADERVMQIVPELKKLFEEAVPLWKEPDDGTHPEVERWHNYGVRATIEGQDVTARLPARELKTGQLELDYFDADVRNTEKARKAFRGEPDDLLPKQGLPTTKTLLKDRLLNWLASVKTDVTGEESNKPPSFSITAPVSPDRRTISEYQRQKVAPMEVRATWKDRLRKLKSYQAVKEEVFPALRKAWEIFYTESVAGSFPIEKLAAEAEKAAIPGIPRRVGSILKWALSAHRGSQGFATQALVGGKNGGVFLPVLETGLESKETIALRGEIRALVRLNGGKITTEARRKSERLQELLSREYATGDVVKVHESLDVVCEPLRALAEKRGADPDAVFQDLFNAKMIAERDLELSGAIGERARLIDKGVDPEAANRVLDALKAEYGEDYQVLEDVSRGVRSWSDAAILEPLVRSGRLNEDVAGLMRKSNQYYVPFFRLMDEMEERGFVGRGTGIFEVRKIPVSEIKGSERKIMDPLSMLVSLAYRSADAAARATVARTIAEVPFFSQAGEGIEVVRAKFFPVPVELRQEVDPELRAGLQGIADALAVRVEVKERLKDHSNALGMYAQMVDREASGGLISEEERKWIQLMFGSSEKTLAHEVGHAIDAYYAKEKDGKRIGGLVSALMATPEMKRELRAIADRRLGDASSETFKKYARRREEQVAEFVSLYINDRGLAVTMAPNACEAFVRFCSRRDVLKPLLGLRPSGKADISTMEGRAWTRSPFPPEPNTMLYYQNGAPYWLKMPADLYRACMGMNPGDVGLAVKLAAKPASWLRSGAVLTPEFISRNPLRDILMAWVFNRHGFSFRGWFSDFFELLGKKEEAKKLFAKFQASGGAFADLATMFLETQKLTVEQIQGKRKGVKYCAHPMEALREISSFVENVTRYSVYRQALENGASNAEAVHEARTITLDYHRFGGSPYIRALNMIIPFFNASLQGIDKVGAELLSGDPKRALKVLQRITLGITLPSVLLWAMFGDDDRIKNLESWERNLFWHIPLPGGPIIRFPKPFEVGIAFGSIPERMLDFASTGDKHGLRQAVAQAFDSVTPPMWPAILRPFAEQSSNWNFFTGRAIEDEAMKNLPAELRSKPWTSEAAKFFSSHFGKYAGISPVMFENHMRSLFGGIGASYVLPMIDFAMRKTGAAKDIPKMDEPVYHSLPFIRALISREAGGFKSKASSDFYENAARSYTADQGWKALWKRGQIEDAMRMLREHPEAIFAGSARKAMSDLSRIRKEREAILADPKMTGDRKRARAAELDSRVDVIVGVQQALMTPRVMERIRAPFIDKLKRSGPTRKDIDSYYDFLNEPVLRAARVVEMDWPSIRKLSSRERSERIVGLIKRGQNRGVAVTTGGNQGKNANPILGIPFNESKTLSSESMYQ